MLIASATFANANHSDGAHPVYAVSFGTLLGDAIPTFYTTAPVRGVSTSPILHRRPQLSDASISPLEGRSSLGGARFELLNHERAVEALLSAHPMVQRDATIALLYASQPWADRMTRFTGQIGDVSRSQDGLVYTFDVESRLGLLDRDILKEEDLAGEFYAGPSRTWSQSTSLFGYAKLVLSDSDADSVYDTVTLTGHPVNIALCLMNSGSGDGGAYDVFPAWAAAGVPMASIDLAKWAYVRDVQWPLVEMRFTLGGKERLQSFIEAEVCKVLGGYLIVSGDGRIGCRFFEAPRSTDTLESFDDDVIIQDTLRWAGNYDDYVSHVRFELDHDGSGFLTQYPAKASPEWLAGRYQVPTEVKISSRGLQTDLGGASVAAVITGGLFRRYGMPPAKVQWAGFFVKSLCEAGDIVRLRSITYPNQESPAPLGDGEDRLIEVLSAKLRDDRVELSGLDLSLPLSGGERLAIINDNGLDPFTLATDVQKEKAYLASGATGKLSDSTPGYVWS